MKKDPLIGQTLANFLVDRPLGRGGMAQVYFGIDRSLERPVALKVIDSRYQGDPEFARRFVDEAKLIARWRHENIVQVYYAGNEGDVYFYAMEFIDGLGLETIMQRYLEQGTLMPHDEVLKIGKAIASALDYAHKQGVVHRDIKPSNIMVSREDRVVLMDFGLALDMGQGSMGQVFGTPHYISPEQAKKSSDATAQSDIYSFGVVLYEMLVGTIPFDDPSAATVAVQHITQEPPLPTSINPALSAEIEQVLLKALAKAPQDRYKTATEMLTALDIAITALKKSQPSPAAPLLPPAATSDKGSKLSNISISDMLALDLDAEDDGPSTIYSIKDKMPIHNLSTQKIVLSPEMTQAAIKNRTAEVKALPNTSQVTATATPVARDNRTGLLVALGAALIVVSVVMMGLVIANMGRQTTHDDLLGTQTQVAMLSAANQATLTRIAQTQATVVQAATDVPSPSDSPATNPTDDLGATATTIILTNDAVNLSNTSVAMTNEAVLGQSTNAVSLAQTQAADSVLATSNANLQLTLTSQALPSPTAQANQATSPAFANGIPLELTYNSAGFYLRNNSSTTNVRLSNLSFRALDANGNGVGSEFNGIDWTTFYTNVDRNGRCVVIELLDQSAWTRPSNCVAAGGGQAYNSILTFPTNDQRIFWDGRNGASQFAVSWSGTEAGRCAIADGICNILVGN